MHQFATDKNDISQYIDLCRISLFCLLDVISEIANDLRNEIIIIIVAIIIIGAAF